MADEFVKLSKSSEPNLDAYLTALDRYLLERYNEIKQNQKFLDKIRNKIGTSWDFAQLFEKAKDQSKKNNTHLILEYIDLLDKTKNIGDDWITNDGVRKAVENIKNRVYDMASSKLDEASHVISNLKNIFDTNSKNLEKESEKIKEPKKHPLTKLTANITTIGKALTETYELIPTLKNLLT